MLALGLVEGEAERLGEHAAKLPGGGKPGSFLDASQRVARVGREEERHVFGPGKGSAVEEHVLEELAKRAAKPSGRRVELARAKKASASGQSKEKRSRSAASPCRSRPRRTKSRKLVTRTKPYSAR